MNAASANVTGSISSGGSITVTSGITAFTAYNGTEANITSRIWATSLSTANLLVGASATVNLGPSTTLHGGGVSSGTFGAASAGNVWITGNITLNAGTTSMAPIRMRSGTNLTYAEAGAVEYDGAVFYSTNDATVGRGVIPTTQVYKLISDGSAISQTAAGTSANYFGATSNIPLSASGIYEIEIVAHFSKTTSTTLVWNLAFTGAAPTRYTVAYEMSPVTGVVAAPGTATMLAYQIPGQNSQTYTITTGALTTGVNHYARIKLFVVNSASATGLQVQAYNGAAGSYTPLTGSYWKCTRLPGSNNSTYVA